MTILGNIAGTLCKAEATEAFPTSKAVLHDLSQCFGVPFKERLNCVIRGMVQAILMNYPSACAVCSATAPIWDYHAIDPLNLMQSLHVTYADRTANICCLFYQYHIP